MEKSRCRTLRRYHGMEIWCIWDLVDRESVSFLILRFHDKWLMHCDYDLTNQHLWQHTVVSQETEGWQVCPVFHATIRGRPRWQCRRQLFRQLVCSFSSIISCSMVFSYWAIIWLSVNDSFIRIHKHLCIYWPCKYRVPQPKKLSSRPTTQCGFQLTVSTKKGCSSLYVCLYDLHSH